MSDHSDNLASQVGEISALSSIYGADWITEDPLTRTYSIEIKGEASIAQGVASLQVTLPAEYPSDSPPTYEINAPWLRGEDRTILNNALEKIYVDNIINTLSIKINAPLELLVDFCRQ